MAGFVKTTVANKVIGFVYTGRRLPSRKGLGIITINYYYYFYWGILVHHRMCVLITGVKAQSMDDINEYYTQSVSELVVPLQLITLLERGRDYGGGLN